MVSRERSREEGAPVARRPGRQSGRQSGRRLVSLASCALLVAGLGGKCGGGDGSGGDPSRVTFRSFDVRCTALPDPFGFPPGWDFVPGVPGRALAAVFAPPTLVPLDVQSVPFQSPDDAEPFLLPGDADGDGRPEPFQAIDGVFGIAPDLALVTSSGFEAVLFVDPRGGLRTVELETPLGLPPGALRGWPEPGPENAAQRTGLQNFTCIAPPPGALDSRGDLLADVLDPKRDCREGVPSFRSNFTAGAALMNGRLFAAVSNLGGDRSTDHTQYLPGAVTVYDVDFSLDPPRVSPTLATPDGESFILSTAVAEHRSFNATHTTAYTTPSGRPFVLVSHTGAIGIPLDDPDTDVIEGGATRITDGSIDVIDAVRLRLVASFPLRDANPALNGPAIDPSGRVAMIGDITSRNLYAVDLAALEDLPRAGEPGADEVQLLSHAVIFDRTPGRSFELPHLRGGAPVATCPGSVLGLDFSHDGRSAYAIDACDGSLATLDVDLSGDPALPVSGTRFSLREIVALTAPVREDTVGLSRQPVELKVRPGEPGVDFSGPDVFFLISEPEGQLCGLHVGSPEAIP